MTAAAGDEVAAGAGAESGSGSGSGSGKKQMSRGTMRILALGPAAVVLFSTIKHSGIWDPYELDAADLARRIAINVFGAGSLALPKASSVMPTLTDLKMGELPFTSMALAFRLFGLHDWVGRLPLAVWGFAAVVTLYLFLERLVHQRAALYATVALVTMPLFFMQARTMLGDVVTMSALTLAFCGLAGAVFDDVREGLAPRVAWMVVGQVGLLAGYFSRGLILGMAVPALGVGLAWLVVRGAKIVRSTESDVFGAVALVTGCVALVAGWRLFVAASFDAPLARGLGFLVLKRPPIEATWDLTVRQLGHGLFPWSAFVPLAIGRLLRAPPGADGPARAREGAIRVAVLVGASVALVAYAFVAPRAGNLPFSAPALLAAIVALAVHDFARGAPASRSVVVATLLLTAVLFFDFWHEPDRAFACFVVDKPQFPKSYELLGKGILGAGTAAFVFFVGLSWFEDQPEGRGDGFVAWCRDIVRVYRAILDELSSIWQGNLAFVLTVFEAGFIGLAAMIFVGRRVNWAAVERLPKLWAGIGMLLWWVVPLALAIAPVLLLGVRDAFRVLVRVTRTTRASWTLIAGMFGGGALSFGFYPALTSQISPKEVFEAYANVAHAGEPLGLLGVRVRAASYYARGDVEAFADAGRAFAWLTETEARRFLVVKSEDLPKLNALHRTATQKNLPIVDARSSQILLASNKLDPGAKNQNPLADIALDDPVTPAHPVKATFEDQLEALGWDVTDTSGHRVDAVVPSTHYRLRFYYRVLRPMSGGWKAFVHVDGYQRRYNGDHVVCDGRYPMNLWQAGDVIVDDTDFQLEPNFTPGDYAMFYGFFTGETRFRVTDGPQHDNRVMGGNVTVR